MCFSMIGVHLMDILRPFVSYYYVRYDSFSIAI